MKRNQKTVVGVVAAASLMIATAVHGNPGDMAGQGMMQGGMGNRMMHGGMMGGGMMGHAMGPGTGMGPGAMGQGQAGRGAAQQLMTPEERTALQGKMRNAKTAEERQQIAAATHAEMQKRAKEKGITLPEGRGPGAGFGQHNH